MYILQCKRGPLSTTKLTYLVKDKTFYIEKSQANDPNINWLLHTLLLLYK